MNKEKQFDCVKFKRKLHENSFKKSGAKNLEEYVDYVNRMAEKSSLHKTEFKNEGFRIKKTDI